MLVTRIKSYFWIISKFGSSFGHITFWIFYRFWPNGGHWEKMLYRNIVKLFELFKHVLALLPHWQHPGSLCGHPDIIQTPTDTLQTPRNSPPILVEMGHWEKVEYIEIKIPTQLSSIVLALIYSRYSPEGPGHPTGGAGGAHGGR